MASSLARKGFKKGEVFAIFSTNCPEYAVIFHAVAMLGGINTPLNPLYTAEEAAFQLRDAGARFLITAPLCLEKAAEAARKSGNIEELFVFGEVEGATRDGRLWTSIDENFLEVTAEPTNGNS